MRAKMQVGQMVVLKKGKERLGRIIKFYTSNGKRKLAVDRGLGKRPLYLFESDFGTKFTVKDCQKMKKDNKCKLVNPNTQAGQNRTTRGCLMTDKGECATLSTSETAWVCVKPQDSKPCFFEEKSKQFPEHDLKLCGVHRKSNNVICSTRKVPKKRKSKKNTSKELQTISTKSKKKIIRETRNSTIYEVIYADGHSRVVHEPKER